MADLVGTCPKDFWEEWIAEGDAAGEPESGQEWGWYSHHRLIYECKVGDRFYVVAHRRLRGYSIVTGFGIGELGGWRSCIIRKGNAVACTLDKRIQGFRGLRRVWWKREDEKRFPEWRKP